LLTSFEWKLCVIYDFGRRVAMLATGGFLK